MDLTENQLLVYFITKTSMFIKDDRESICAFILGYEMGKEARVSTNISKLLEDAYDCPRRAMGWNGQVQLYADKLGLPWESAFKKAALEMVMNRRAKEEDKKIQEFIKSMVVLRISQLQTVVLQESKARLSYFDDNWIIGWLGIVDVEKEWFQGYWSEKELAIIQRIDLEIHLHHRNAREGKTEPSRKLVELSKEFDRIKSAPEQP